jgi:hypothetical protein
VYYGTDTRVFGVLIGALAAVLLVSGRVGRRAVVALPVLGTLGLVVVLVASRRFDDRTDGLYRGGLFALSLGVALLVLAVTVAPRRGVAPLLSWRPLRAVGLVSYGLYLYHWPVFIYVSERTTGRTGLSLFLLRSVVTAAAAIASYFLVERPIRERRLRWPGRVELLAVGGVAVLVLALTVTLPEAPTLPAAAAAPAAGPGGAGAPVGAAVTTAPVVSGSPAHGAGSGSAASPAGPAGAAPLRILGAGDSVGFTFVYYWPQASTPGVTIDGVAALGCRLQEGVIIEDGHEAEPTKGCPDWRTTWATRIATFRPDLVVLFATEWEVFDARVGEHEIDFGSAESDAAVRRYLGDLAAMTRAAGSRLVLVASPPITAPDQPDGSPRHRGQEWRVEHLNALYRTYAAEHPDAVSVLSMDRVVCAADPCSYDVGGQPVFTDGLHFDAAGMRAVAPRVLPLLRQMAAATPAR